MVGRHRRRTFVNMLSTREGNIAELFFALGDETRLSVVRRLGAGDALSATSLSHGAHVTRQAITKHLQVLEMAGLVSHEKHGREVVYVLTSRRIEEARSFLDALSAGWDRAIDRLRQAVEAPDSQDPKSGRKTFKATRPADCRARSPGCRATGHPLPDPPATRRPVAPTRNRRR